MPAYSDNATSVNNTLISPDLAAGAAALEDIAGAAEDIAAAAEVAEVIADIGARFFEAFVIFVIMAMAFWRDKVFLYIMAWLVCFYVGFLWFKEYTALSMIVVAIGAYMVWIPLWRKLSDRKKKKNGEGDSGGDE